MTDKKKIEFPLDAETMTAIHTLAASYFMGRTVRRGLVALGMKPNTAKRVEPMIGATAYLVGSSYALGRTFGSRVARSVIADYNKPPTEKKPRDEWDMGKAWR